MELLTPGIGLFFWQSVVFLSFFILSLRFVWKPITTSLKERETFIETSLRKAEQAKKESEELSLEKQKYLHDIKIKEEKILKEAKEHGNKYIEEAKAKAKKESEKIIEEAKITIEQQKQAAFRQVHNQIATLVMDVSEKIVKEHITKDTNQEKLIEKYIQNAQL
ncbi:MAG: F0F1 ATP synthase subunit B [Chitinophagaceae bacterium]|nr:F0F1 ATP synthase subunit B [Chitinophagaceae bacterium]